MTPAAAPAASSMLPEIDLMNRLSAFEKMGPTRGHEALTIAAEAVRFAGTASADGGLDADAVERAIKWAVDRSAETAKVEAAKRDKAAKASGAGGSSTSGTAGNGGAGGSGPTAPPADDDE